MTLEYTTFAREVPFSTTGVFVRVAWLGTSSRAVQNWSYFWPDCVYLFLLCLLFHE